MNLSRTTSKVLAAGFVTTMLLQATAFAQTKPADVTPATPPVAPVETPSGPRTEGAILAEYDALKPPALDMEKIKAKDKAYIEDYSGRAKVYSEKRSTLAKELFDLNPENDRLPKLMEARWMSPANAAEVEAVITSGKPAQLVPLAYGTRVNAAFRKSAGKAENLADVQKAVAEFEAKFPEDKRSAQFTYQLLQMASDDQKPAIEQHLLTAYPASNFSEMIRAKQHQLAQIGKPFELSFTEAVTGTPMNMEALRGKVVVIDFWATWCGPCVAEMPKMKALYAEYKDKGVEFIGVSLDQPEATGKGLTKLKEFVAKNEIAWPQYYQGNYWQSEFSKSWGINSIPCVFIVDKQGNLHSTSARGKLEEMIPELLAK